MAIKKVLVNKLHFNREEKQCSRCNTLFYVQPSKASRFSRCPDCRAAIYHAPVTLRCSACDSEFTVKGYLRTVRRFCSVACRWKAHYAGTGYEPPLPRKPGDPLHERLCLGCKERFSSYQPRRLYCSNACSNRTQRRPDELCDYCGNLFNGKRRSDKKSNLKFCNHQCKGAYFSGDRHHLWISDRDSLRRDDRGPDWEEIAAAIRKRDGYHCRRCGIPQPEGRLLDVHHIEPYRIAKNNEADNLISLCPRCHKIAEHHGL